MASASGPIASPMSPAVKRSTRKRQRPAFFAEEITTSAAPSASKKHSSQRASSSTSSSSSSARHRQQTPRPSTQSHMPAKRARSELSDLQDTVTGLRAQIESATVQMQELRSLVTMLADLYRDEQHTQDEPALFSPAPSSSLEDTNDTDEMFSTTASEYDDVYDDEQDELLKTPLSPL